ncbi:hypothetical protein C8F01DRAFT_107127 [Mycena amicta]|nr:hypothetical protein C8F01DRAFT_107127 [Mycena amicta]
MGCPAKRKNRSPKPKTPITATSAILISPGKLAESIAISSPSVRGTCAECFQDKRAATRPQVTKHTFRISMLPGEREEEVQRERPDGRHAKLKIKAKEQSFSARLEALERTVATMREEHNKDREERTKDREELAQLRERVGRHTTLSIAYLREAIPKLEEAIASSILVEKYEVINAVLQAYNDRIFDLQSDPGLTREEKNILKAQGLFHILQLLDACPEFDVDDHRATPVDLALHAAFQLLGETEWKVCYSLAKLRNERNEAQHPRPDHSTAERWLTQLVPDHRETFMDLLDSNPVRMKTRHDDDFTDLRIFAEDGEYDGSPEAQQLQLNDLKEMLKREEEAAGAQ